MTNSDSYKEKEAWPYQICSFPSWLLGDHLGSTSMVADASGVAISEVRYSTFGETRYQNGTLTTDYLYTGQRQEAEIGLYYYVARWYDPAIGRFIQADSVVPNPGSALGYDRFAYGFNNPLLYLDPSGHAPILLDGMQTVYQDNSHMSFISYSDGPLAENTNNWQPPPKKKQSSESAEGVLTSDQLEELGITCGGNVDQLVCDLYLNPNDFNFSMTSDFADWLSPGLVNWLLEGICLQVGQGCIQFGPTYTLGTDVTNYGNGLSMWNRIAYNMETGQGSPLFFAFWELATLNYPNPFVAETYGAEIFPLRSGELGYATVLLSPSAENGALNFNSSFVGYFGDLNKPGLGMQIPGAIKFTTFQTGTSSLQTTGSFYFGDIWIGSISLQGTKKP